MKVYSWTIKHYKNIWLLIILLAIILFFLSLETRPFDGDEGIMILIAQNSWKDLLSRAAQDVHPPLFHVLLKLFISGGIDEWSARILSALAGIGSVIFTYLFTKKLFDQKPQSQTLSLISTLLFTISPYLIYPFQEARMYSLFLFLMLASYYFLLILIGEKSSWIRWIGYIFFSVLMLYTHYLGFVVLFSQIVYILFFDPKIASAMLRWKSSRLNSNNILKWIGSWIIIAVLFLPQLPTMAHQFTARISEQSQTLSIADNIKGFIGAIYRFGSGRLFLDLSNFDGLTSNVFSFIGFLITLIVPTWILIKGVAIVYKKHKGQFWFLAVPIITAIVLAIFSSEIGSKSSRYLIYIFPFYMIFISFGFLDYCKRKWTIIISLMFLAISISGLIYHYGYEIKAPGVNKVAEFISQKYQNGDIVLIRGGFGGGEEWIFRYYYYDTKTSVQYVLEIYDMLGNYSAGNLAELKAIKPENKIKELLQNHDRVFFYDMTYETKNIPDSKEYVLGQDKERKNLTVWETIK